jgi:hypothetical protein
MFFNFWVMLLQQSENSVEHGFSGVTPYIGLRHGKRRARKNCHHPVIKERRPENVWDCQAPAGAGVSPSSSLFHSRAMDAIPRRNRTAIVRFFCCGSTAAAPN